MQEFNTNPEAWRPNIKQCLQEQWTRITQLLDELPELIMNPCLFVHLSKNFGASFLSQVFVGIMTSPWNGKELFFHAHPQIF